MRQKAWKRLRWLLYEEREQQHVQQALVHLLSTHNDYDYQCLNVYDTSQSSKLKDLLIVHFIGKHSRIEDLAVEDLSTSAVNLLFDLFQVYIYYYINNT